MVIGIDASKLVAVSPTGVERYARRIIEGLIGHYPQENFRLYSYAPVQLEVSQRENVQLRILPWARGRGWIRGRFSWEIWRRPPEVLFVPANRLPWSRAARTITAIQDVGFKRFPQGYRAWQRRYLESATSEALARADAIAVPSQSTRDEIKKYYPDADIKKVKVIPHGVAADFWGRDRGREALPSLLQDQKRPFFVFVGRLDYRKNVTRLIEAYNRYRADGGEEQLVLAGAAGIGYEAIQRVLSVSPVKSDIIELGHVPDEQIAALYAYARGLVFPSLYEGFGLPILEAYAAGCPALIGDNTSQPEVAGDLGIKVSVEEVADIARGLAKLAAHPGRRAELIQHAAAYSWQNAAVRTMRLITAS